MCVCVCVRACVCELLGVYLNGGWLLVHSFLSSEMIKILPVLVGFVCFLSLFLLFGVVTSSATKLTSFSATPQTHLAALALHTKQQQHKYTIVPALFFRDVSRDRHLEILIFPSRYRF